MTSPHEEKESLLLRLKRKLHLTPKKKVEDYPPRPFQKFKKEQQLTSPEHHSSSHRITYSRKIHIPHLRAFKRYTAGLLFLINGLFFILTLTAPTSASSPQTLLVLFFCGNTFILLDYLYKTSHLKIVRDERK